MSRKNKVKITVEETTKVLQVKPTTLPETNRKTVVANDPVVAKCSSLNDVTSDQLDKLLNNTEQSKKIVQLINDYAFETDQQERIRCVSIAFGNWRYGAEFDPTKGSEDLFEQHNFAKCKSILERLVIV